MYGLEFIFWLVFFFVVLWIINSIIDLSRRRIRSRGAKELEPILYRGELDYGLKDCHDCMFCRPLLKGKSADMWCRHPEAMKKNLGYPVESDCSYWKPMRNYEDLDIPEKKQADNQDGYILIDNSSKGNK